MSESNKAICVVLLMAGLVACGLSWTDDAPNDTVWLIRIVGVVATVVSSVVFLYIHFRRDKAPDYLRAEFGDYFNRNGLAFVCDWTVERGIAYLTVYFQNQYSRPSIGEIALRPRRGLFARRSDLEPIEVRVECGPGAFGVARLAAAIPARMQGTPVKFDVGANVSYPEGKDSQLRYHEGKTLRWNTSFRNPFGSFLSVAGLCGGALVWTSRPGLELWLPNDVEAMLDFEPQMEMKTVWRLGDPLL